jgi:hypothetical protein
MARNHLKRKLESYQALAFINTHFEAIAGHVQNLGQKGFFRTPKMRVFHGLVRELQSQISHDLCDQMHTVEDKDMLEFGKVRIEREHYLNPDLPAFRDKRFTPEKPATEPPSAQVNGSASATEAQS